MTATETATLLAIVVALLAAATITLLVQLAAMEADRDHHRDAAQRFDLECDHLLRTLCRADRDLADAVTTIAIAERLAVIEAEHGELDILVNWDECPAGEVGGHEPSEAENGDMICWTCPKVATVCYHCHDEYGENRDWPCATVDAIHTPAGERP